MSNTVSRQYEVNVKTIKYREVSALQLQDESRGPILGSLVGRMRSGWLPVGSTMSYAVRRPWFGGRHRHAAFPWNSGFKEQSQVK